MKGARLGFLLGLALLGCATRLPAPADVLTRPSLDTILSSLREQEGRIHSLRALSQVEIHRGGRHLKVKEALILELPGRLRLETLGVGGLPILVVASDGERLYLHSLTDQVLLVGRAGPENLGHLMGISLHPTLLVRLLSGKAPLPLESPGATLALGARQEGYPLLMLQGSWRQRLFIDPKGLTIERGELYQGEDLLLRFSFQDLREAGPFLFPYRISLEQPGGIALHVEYETLELDPSLSSDIFRLEIQDGGRLRVIDLDREPF